MFSAHSGIRYIGSPTAFADEDFEQAVRATTVKESDNISNTGLNAPLALPYGQILSQVIRFTFP